MRIVAAALALLPLAAFAAQPAQRDTDAATEVPRTVQPGRDPMNVYRQKAGCTPVPQQVAGTERRNGTRLDQQPPGRALLAVDRQVDGCREVTLVSEERRRQGR